jgi:hypothetical protein
MKTAIQALRQFADECEDRAMLSADRESKANLIVLANNCHWLAGKADQLKAARVDRLV